MAGGFLPDPFSRSRNYPHAPFCLLPSSLPDPLLPSPSTVVVSLFSLARCGGVCGGSGEVPPRVRSPEPRVAAPLTACADPGQSRSQLSDTASVGALLGADVLCRKAVAGLNLRGFLPGSSAASIRRLLTG